MHAIALPSLRHVRGWPRNALDNAGLPRCTHPDNNSASRLLQQPNITLPGLRDVNISITCSVLANANGACVLRHGIQISMEAILACHPAWSTEWLDCVAKGCELRRIRTGPTFRQKYRIFRVGKASVHWLGKPELQMPVCGAPFEARSEKFSQASILDIKYPK